MSRTPFLTPSAASEVLALVSAAKAHAGEAWPAWLQGYATRAAGEPVVEPAARQVPLPPLPREEPGEGGLGVPVARVLLGRHPPG